MKNFILLMLEEYQPTHTTVLWIFLLLIKLRDEKGFEKLANHIDKILDDFSVDDDKFDVTKKMAKGLRKFQETKGCAIKYHDKFVWYLRYARKDYRYIRLDLRNKKMDGFDSVYIDLTDSRELSSLILIYEEKNVTIGKEGWNKSGDYFRLYMDM